MEVTEPTDWQLYVGQRWEGRPDCHYRSTVAPIYQHRVLDNQYKATKEAHQIRKSQGYFISSPHGFCK
jgi:hypothetical protein